MFKETVTRSKIVKFLYKSKTYIEIASSQIGFISGKALEIFGAIALAERLFNTQIVGVVVAWIFLGVLLSAVAVGWFLKRTGLYDVDVYTRVSKDPFQSEMLEYVRGHK